MNSANEMIYLDNNATTKIDPRVLEAMMPFFTEEYANAASNHAFGTRVNQYIKFARKQVAKVIGAESDEIIFTSGATEAINMALKGVTERYGDIRKQIITVTTEHPAVLDTCKYLEKKGFDVIYLNVNSDGMINSNEIKSKITENTLMVCVMLANNETGVIQPIKELASLAHNAGALFMTDATQAVGKIPIEVDELDVDLMAFSAHKFFGPKGIGALYIRSHGKRKLKLEALIQGGGHERGLRSGTLNVPAIVGFGRAATIAQSEMKKNAEQLDRLRNYLEAELLEIEGVAVNGNTGNRMPHVSNLRFNGIDSDAIIVALSNPETDLPLITISNGSACSSTSLEPSHVLIAMGLSEQEAFSSIRFSLSKFNNKKELEITIKAIKEIINTLKLMS